MSTFVGTRTTGLTDIDALLVHEAERIGSDIHAEMVHTSPWIDLIPKDKFPEGMGYRLQTLIYERALPTNANQDTVGLTWGDFAGADSGTANGVINNVQDNSALNRGTGGIIDDSAIDYHGPLANNLINEAAATNPSRVDWVKRVEPYQLQRATVWSPEVSIEDLLFAAHRNEQLQAMFDALTEATRYGWEERYRDEYQRVCTYLVECVTNGTTITTTSPAAGTATDANERIAGATVEADLGRLSNAIMDTIYNRLIRSGAGKNAWGRANGRPVFGLVCSSECSLRLLTENPGPASTDQTLDHVTIREDVRHADAAELLKPLGVDRAFRGWAHICDDLITRYDSDGATPTESYVRREPYTIDGTTLLISPDTNYDSAQFEIAYVLHADVMKSLIPQPPTGGAGVKFDPADYSGKFHWLNIKSVDLNPLGTIGHFLGVLASATKVVKPDFGWVLLFDRQATGYATAN